MQLQVSVIKIVKMNTYPTLACRNWWLTIVVTVGVRIRVNNVTLGGLSAFEFSELIS